MTRSKAISPFRTSHLLSKAPVLVGAVPELLCSVVGSAFNRGQPVIHCHGPRAFLVGIGAAWLLRPPCSAVHRKWDGFVVGQTVERSPCLQSL